MKRFHLHLVSDSTGETNASVARACLAQFDGADPIEHVWSMIRSDRQAAKAIAGIVANPGIVVFTLVDDAIRRQLVDACRERGLPCVSVLDPVLAAFADFLHAEAGHRPGRQHVLDADYFARIAAIALATWRSLRIIDHTCSMGSAPSNCAKQARATDALVSPVESETRCRWKRFIRGAGAVEKSRRSWG